MSITEYEQKFLYLLAFSSGIQLSEVSKANMFPDHLNPRYKDLVKV